MVCIYHCWMGGVDFHDQLRLQRYSLQMAMVSKKYFRTIFGLLDMAIVIAYIMLREVQKGKESDRQTTPSSSRSTGAAAPAPRVGL